MAKIEIKQIAVNAGAIFGVDHQGNLYWWSTLNGEEGWILKEDKLN